MLCCLSEDEGNPNLEGGQTLAIGRRLGMKCKWRELSKKIALTIRHLHYGDQSADD